MTNESSGSTTGSSVERAFRVLQEVVAADGEVGVREIGRRTGLPRSTVSRLVATLDGLGMVARTAGGGVVVGSALSTLHPAGGSTPVAADRLRPILIELAERYGEHAALAVDGGDAVLYLAEVSTEQPVSAPEVAGQRHPFHLVAPGLMAMAWWDDRRLDGYLATELERVTASSVTDPMVVRARVAAARADGHVWTDQEFDVGVNGLAVPVVGGDGELVAAVSLYGPSYRFSPQQFPDLGQRLGRLTAERAATLLGSEGIGGSQG